MVGYHKGLGECCGEKAVQTDDFSDLVCVLTTSTPDSKEPQPNAEAAAAPSLANISHFTQKLVEKLRSGMFSADPRHILLFIIDHIMVVRILGRPQWVGGSPADPSSVCMTPFWLLSNWIYFQEGPRVLRLMGGRRRTFLVQVAPGGC